MELAGQHHKQARRSNTSTQDAGEVLGIYRSPVACDRDCSEQRSRRAFTYLVFRGDEHLAKNLGAIENNLKVSNPTEPQFRIEYLDGKPRWIVLKSGGSAGSAMSIWKADWYDVTEAAIPKVFSQIVSGHDCNMSMWVHTGVEDVLPVRASSSIMLIVDRWKKIDEVKDNSEAFKTLMYKRAFEVHRYDPTRKRFEHDLAKSRWANKQLTRIWCNRNIGDFEKNYRKTNFLASSQTAEGRALSQTELKTLDNWSWRKYVSKQPFIWVDADKQMLHLIRNQRVTRTFACSTAKLGIGNISGSYKTPVGWHAIGSKHGKDLPSGAILKGRSWTGKVWKGEDRKGDDLVLSRVLRLSGLEPGLNKGGRVDSWKRYIYIHGTSHEQSIGRPTSRGCVRLKNKHVIDLFQLVDVKTLVLISAGKKTRSN
jgi:hypothetical protein